MKNKLQPLAQQFKKNPLKVVDVGALGGAKEPWHSYLEHLQIIGFEPQESSYSQSHFEMDNVALFDEVGTFDMYITKRTDSSSLLEPNRRVLDRYGGSESFDITEKISVTTDTLDNQIEKYKIDFVDFIKLDTQGSELHILKKARNTLQKSVFGIEVEINFIQRYQEQACFSEVDTFLKESGFELFDIQNRFHKRKGTFSYGEPKGQLTHGTALYFRTIEAAEKLITRIQDKELKTALILHYLSVSLVYGYNDFAWEIFTYFKTQIPAELHTAIKNIITEESTTTPSFPGKYKVSVFLEFLTKICTPRSKTGKTGDRNLGNF